MKDVMRCIKNQTPKIKRDCYTASCPVCLSDCLPLIAWSCVQPTCIEAIKVIGRRRRYVIQLHCKRPAVGGSTAAKPISNLSAEVHNLHAKRHGQLGKIFCAQPMLPGCTKCFASGVLKAYSATTRAVWRGLRAQRYPNHRCITGRPTISYRLPLQMETRAPAMYLRGLAKVLRPATQTVAAPSANCSTCAHEADGSLVDTGPLSRNLNWQKAVC